MDFLRPEIAALEQNGITRVALTRIGDPKVIALWFGEGDTVTDEFIREAAKEALDAGDTFYAHTRGRQALRDALKRLPRRPVRDRSRSRPDHGAGRGHARHHHRGTDGIEHR